MGVLWGHALRKSSWQRVALGKDGNPAGLCPWEGFLADGSSVGLCPQEGFLADGSSVGPCPQEGFLADGSSVGPCPQEGFLADGSIPSRPTSCCSSHVHDSAFSLLRVVHSGCLGPSRPLLTQDGAQILCACLSKHPSCPGPVLVRAELSTDSAVTSLCTRICVKSHLG